MSVHQIEVSVKSHKNSRPLHEHYTRLCSHVIGLSNQRRLFSVWCELRLDRQLTIEHGRWSIKNLCYWHLGISIVNLPVGDISMISCSVANIRRMNVCQNARCFSWKYTFLMRIDHMRANAPGRRGHFLTGWYCLLPMYTLPSNWLLLKSRLTRTGCARGGRSDVTQGVV